MPNAAMMTFAGFGDFDPVLIAPDQSNRVTACLQALAMHKDAEQIFGSADLATHDDYWPNADSWMSSYKPYIVKAGILQIPVKGVLMHNFPYAVGTYATGYYYIQKALERGVADPDVRGIALVCDTPGGHVAGCFELCDKIYKARSEKPIAAFAHEHAYSAGYAIFSSAKKGTVSRTGGVGSIGVVTSHFDWSKAAEAEGLKVTFIFAGKHKVDGNPYEPLSDGAKKRIQARIDESYGVFVSAVARNRGLDEKQIRGTEALTFGATDAVDQKLADAVGPLDEAMAEFSECLLGATDEEDYAMTQVSQADHEAALAAEREKATAAATAAATKAATDAKARIVAIKTCDAAKTRPAAAEALAMESDMDSATAIAVLAKMPEEGKPAASTETTTTNAGDKGFSKVMDAESRAQAGAGDDDEASTKKFDLATAEGQDAEAERLLDARFGRGSTAAPRKAGK